MERFIKASLRAATAICGRSPKFPRCPTKRTGFLYVHNIDCCTRVACLRLTGHPYHGRYGTAAMDRRGMEGSPMQQPDFEHANQYALARLEQELHPSLTYHSLAHTRDSVVPAVERLAELEGVDGDGLLLLRTAAWYHDIGYTEQPIDHEVLGVRIAAMILPTFGFTQAQIAAIGGMIMATKLPQSPRTKLEELLADADLDVLGSKDFLERNQALRAELAVFGMRSTDAEWYGDQLRFLQQHQYWTAAAATLRSAGKQRNIEALTRLLAHVQPQQC